MNPAGFLGLGLDPSDLLHPEALGWRPWLLALGGLHLLLFVQQWWWQRRQFDTAALRRFGPGLSLWRGAAKTALWTLAGWQLLTALAVPLGPPVKIEGKQYGADVIFCVDVSSSMKAMDVQPNRLEAVKRALGGLLERMQGDRVGLVAFAGGAVVACPLTTDYDTTGLFLGKLDVDSVPRDGTDLASALQMALDGFGRDTQRGKLIVLATDGEDTVNSDVLEQARRAKEAGVAVECVGIGSAEGALIPGQRDLFGRIYAKQWHGQPVRTKLDRAGLERIAAATGGEYLPGDSAASLDRMTARIARLKQGLGAAPDRTVREPLFQAPLLWAMALLLADSLLSARGRGWRRAFGALARWFSRLWRPSRGATLLLCLLALSAPAFADLDGGRSQYNQGNDAYRHGDYGAAADSYRQAAAGQSLQEAADYNLGNALFQKQDYQGAIDAYGKALDIDPGDQDAQYNKDLAQQMLDRQKKNPQDKKKDDKKNQDQQNGRNQQNQQGGGGQGGDQQQGGQQQGRGQSSGGGRGGQDGQRQGNQQGQAQPGQQQRGGGQPSGQRPGQSSQRLSRDQIEAMMNQLRLDQRKYSGAFNPLKKFGRKDEQPQDPMQQMLEQMSGIKMPKKDQDQTQADPNYKDW